MFDRYDESSANSATAAGVSAFSHACRYASAHAITCAVVGIVALLLGRSGEHYRDRAGTTGVDAGFDQAATVAAGTDAGVRRASCFTIHRASRLTPGITSDASANWNGSPMKYRPGSLVTTPRSCMGAPSSPKIGRSIHERS